MRGRMHSIIMTRAICYLYIPLIFQQRVLCVVVGNYTKFKLPKLFSTFVRFFLSKQFGLYFFFNCILLILIFGIGTCSAFAPDERLYSQIFQSLYTNQSTNLQYFAGTSKWIYQAFFYPASLFSKMGLDPIFSIRLSSLFFFQFIILLTWNLIRSIPITFKPPIFLIPLGLSFSLFFFSSLGLRESLVYLNLVFYFYSLRILKHGRGYLGGILLFLSLVVFANLKFYLYILVTLSAFFALVFL